ncbi:MAG: hypothetical protein EHM56_07145, partial [Chloroflexi bacterium]
MRRGGPSWRRSWRRRRNRNWHGASIPRIWSSAGPAPIDTQEVQKVSSDGPPGTARDDNGVARPSLDKRLVLRLYIAGRGPNSVRALANLDALAQDFGRDYFEIEVVDVLVEPLRALRDHVLVTPTLVKL